MAVRKTPVAKAAPVKRIKPIAERFTKTQILTQISENTEVLKKTWRLR